MSKTLHDIHDVLHSFDADVDLSDMSREEKIELLQHMRRQLQTLGAGLISNSCVLTAEQPDAPADVFTAGTAQGVATLPHDMDFNSMCVPKWENTFLHPHTSSHKHDRGLQPHDASVHNLPTQHWIINSFQSSLCSRQLSFTQPHPLNENVPILQNQQQPRSACLRCLGTSEEKCFFSQRTSRSCWSKTP